MPENKINMKNETPIARFENIIVQELPDEVLVCDTTTNRMFCLNQTAAEVWKLADGTRDIKEISRLLSKRFKSNVSEELVSFAVAELSRESLLVERIPMSADFHNFSRREVIRRVGMASMIALPLISTLTMPKATYAASSCDPDAEIGEIADGCECSRCFECASGCCLEGICQDGQVCRSAPDCGRGVGCPTGFICCGNPNDPNNTYGCTACGGC